MSRRFHLAMVGLMVLAMACGAGTAAGGISAPRSSAVFSADGSRVLVMRSPWPGGDTRPSIPFPDGRVVNLQTTLSSTGVYEVNGLRPVWRANLFALDWDYLCSDDLEQMVVKNRFARGSDPAVTFYRRGLALKSYSFNDLLKRLRGERFRPYATWDWHYEWDGVFRLTADHRSVELSTAKRHLWLGVYDLGLGEEDYTFDLATGAMTRQRSTVVRTIVMDVLAATALLVVAGCTVGFAFRWARGKLRLRSRQRGFQVITGRAVAPSPDAP